jgi:hypothetical protein
MTPDLDQNSVWFINFCKDFTGRKFIKRLLLHVCRHTDTAKLTDSLIPLNNMSCNDNCIINANTIKISLVISVPNFSSTSVFKGILK